MKSPYPMTLNRHLPAYLWCFLVHISSSNRAGQTDDLIVTNNNNAGPGICAMPSPMANASNNCVEYQRQSTRNLHAGYRAQWHSLIYKISHARHGVARHE